MSFTKTIEVNPAFNGGGVNADQTLSTSCVAAFGDGSQTSGLLNGPSDQTAVLEWLLDVAATDVNDPITGHSGYTNDAAPASVNQLVVQTYTNKNGVWRRSVTLTLGPPVDGVSFAEYPLIAPATWPAWAQVETF